MLIPPKVFPQKGFSFPSKITAGLFIFIRTNGIGEERIFFFFA